MQLEFCGVAPVEWRRLTISAICQSFTSGGTPSRKVPDYFTGSIPWIKTQELTDCILEDSDEHISQEAIAASSAKLLPAKTVLMAMYGATVGQLGVLASPMTCNQACAAMVVDSDKVDYRYLYYQLMAARQQIKSLSTGAAQQNLSGAQIKQFVLPFPDVREQAEIADTLWQIDRRIDLLRKTNITLESIAQALFKSWFIDFDPVRAKQAGREPEGMDAATAALFPAKFEESVLGMIPKGWRAGNLALLCKEGGGFIQTGPFGSQLHASDYQAFGIPVVMPQDIEARRISTERVARVNDAHAQRLERHKLSAGDVVFSRRGDVARHAAVSHAEAGWLCGTGCLLVRPGPKWPSSAFVSQALATPEATEWLKRHAVGATMPNLNTGILGALQILLPNYPVLVAFEGVVELLEARISANRTQAAQLAALRNTLLPRLISGKLRLPDAQAAVAEAA